MTIRPIRPKSRSSRLDNSVATEPPTEASVSPELITLNKMIDQAFDHKSLSEAEWKTDLRLLLDLHAKLKRVISELTSKDLAMIAPGSKVRNVDLLTGIAAHDLYHAGQIQLLKRLHSSSGKLPV